MIRRLIAPALAPLAALALLAACQQAEAPAAPPAGGSTVPQAPEGGASEPAPTSEPTPEPQPVSCETERGLEAARALADQCRQVSPATRPPCHPANPCAMIQAEIDRSCALWAEDGDVPAECAA